MRLPPILNNNHKLGAWCNQVRAYLQSLTPSKGDGTVDVDWTEKGCVWSAKPPRRGGGREGGGGGFRGEWSGTAEYAAGEIVIFTPPGGQAGAYGCAEDPPVGLAPDAGAPYWIAFPLQTPAVWS